MQGGWVGERKRRDGREQRQLIPTGQGVWGRGEGGFVGSRVSSRQGHGRIATWERKVKIRETEFLIHIVTSQCCIGV